MRHFCHFLSKALFWGHPPSLLRVIMAAGNQLIALVCFCTVPLGCDSLPLRGWYRPHCARSPSPENDGPSAGRESTFGDSSVRGGESRRVCVCLCLRDWRRCAWVGGFDLRAESFPSAHQSLPPRVVLRFLFLTSRRSRYTWNCPTSHVLGGECCLRVCSPHPQCVITEGKRDAMSSIRELAKGVRALSEFSIQLRPTHARIPRNRLEPISFSPGTTENGTVSFWNTVVGERSLSYSP